MVTLPLPCRASAFIAFLVVTSLAVAQSTLPGEAVSLDSLDAFKAPAANWQVAGSLAGNPRADRELLGAPGHGLLINRPNQEAHGNLVTVAEFGDAELDLDFLMPPGSNSGVYLMGRYEVQLFDSWGVPNPTFADCGGIYQRWDEARGAGKEGFAGLAPLANAARAPGLWQHLHIDFRAPRFDAAGKKTANARFLSVVLNGFVVQENVEVTGPTRAAAFSDEAASGPLMLQGDHGSVAFRALSIKKFVANGMPARVVDATFKLYAASSDEVGVYDAEKPKDQGPATILSAEAFQKAGKCAVVFSGTIEVPRDGLYAFSSLAHEPIRLLVDDQVALAASQGGGETVPLELKAGRHAFRLDYVHVGWGPPWFTLAVEGPGLAPQQLGADVTARFRGGKPRKLPIEPSADRVRLQRSFVPFDPKKRLYAINVGTPSGIHYAYDFETAAVLRVWRGHFLDTFEMWDGRGENQIAKPTGPALTLVNKPAVVLLERASDDWPDQPDAMWSSQGYSLEKDGQPVFHFKLSSLTGTDRIAPAPGEHGLTRTLVLEGRVTDWESWALLAQADRITRQPDGRGYVIGDRLYYIDVPAEGSLQPVVRTRNGHQQLAVPIGRGALGKPIIYTLVW